MVVEAIFSVSVLGVENCRRESNLLQRFGEVARNLNYSTICMAFSPPTMGPFALSSTQLERES
jgi:hypothetical protein